MSEWEADRRAERLARERIAQPRARTFYGDPDDPIEDLVGRGPNPKEPPRVAMTSGNIAIPHKARCCG
jgi:hypothetical protein